MRLPIDVTELHTYAVDWSADQITCSVDNQLSPGTDRLRAAEPTPTSFRRSDAECASAWPSRGQMVGGDR
ncbi:hypothetical protein [Kribbella deserti]|uniref:Uncharacterized protein n=1 Tax=Kribbella deserti TaxID=1926257 RepID=A0ABV6QIB5_9ACTN